MIMGEQGSHKRSLPREPTAQEEVQKQSISETDTILPAEIIEAAKKAEEAVIPVRTGIRAGEWNPRTQLGKDVLDGKVTSIDQLFDEGTKITEPGIVDMLLPGLAHEIILIGGSTGKGGGVRRTPSRRTSRMHKSGRRYKISAMVVAGNGNGYVGVGYARGPPGRHREIIEKALVKAKLNLVPVMRGCGSWECRDASPHSIPFSVTGKSGSVRITFIPAPRGLGLVVSDEVKKVLRLAGIEDVWSKSRGQTSSRVNTIHAVFDALARLNRLRIKDESKETVGLKTGRVGLGSPLVQGGK